MLNMANYNRGISETQVGARVPQSLADRLDAVAERTRGGRSEVVRRALAAYLDDVAADHHRAAS